MAVKTRSAKKTAGKKASARKITASSNGRNFPFTPTKLKLLRPVPSDI